MRLLTVGLFSAALAACGGNHADVQCEQNSNCDLSGGGMCVAASTGHMWCAYPDPDCSSGYRYSNQDVGDGLGGVCVPGGGSGDGGLNTRRLTVMVGGSGSGSVTSAPPGLTCSGGTCTADFTDGASVALTATASSGTFLGWSNDCTGAGGCDLVMDRDHVVTALFGTPGEALWSQQIGGTQQDFGRAIATDSDGNIIVIGDFQGSFTVGTTTLTSAGSTDVFVAKLSGTDGSILWIKSFGGSNAEQSSSVALDAANNIYIAGYYLGTMNVGTSSITSAGASDGFAVKLDNTGSVQWVKSIGGASSDGAYGVSVHGAVVAVAGGFAGSMTVNGRTVSTTASSTGFVVTFGTDGSAGIVTTPSGAGYTLGNRVVVDNSGNIVLCGSISGTANFGGGSVTSNSGDAFLAKYSSTGTYLFAKVLGGSGQDSCGAVSVSPLDDIFLMGTFSGSVSFGGASPVNANTANLVVAKYSSAGAYDWAQAYGGTTATVAVGSAAVNQSGDIVMAGDFCGNFTLGSRTISSVGTCGSQDYDIFSARLSGSDGSAITSMRAGGSSQDLAAGVAQTPDGRHFVVGSFQGFADFGGTSRTSAGANDAVILALAPQ